MTPWISGLQNLCPGRVRLDEPLAGRTTFRCGARAKAVVAPKDPAELAAVVRLLGDSGVSWQVLGRGSNVLVRDGGYPGALIALEEGFSGVATVSESGSDVRVRAGGGLANGAFLQWLRERNLSGFEFSFGIPGSVGGGIRMNAGTPAGWFGRVVRKVEGIDAAGRAVQMDVRETDFTYRDFPKGRDLVITAGHFVFRKGSPGEITSAIDEARRRRANQPLDLPNLGSVFKNPEGDYAGRLIEAAGLKGRRMGDAQISPKHANFIVNLGAAKTSDVLALMDEAQRLVKEKFKVDLEPEIHVIGAEK